MSTPGQRWLKGDRSPRQLAVHHLQGRLIASGGRAGRRQDDLRDEDVDFAASRRVLAHGQQMHGGIGFAKEYEILLYFRCQKWMELIRRLTLKAGYHRELVAQKLDM